MRIHWEEQDIVAGRVVSKSGSNEEAWIIAYWKEAKDDKCYTLVSLSSGVSSGNLNTDIGMANFLSSWDYWPVELLSKSKKSEAAK